MNSTAPQSTATDTKRSQELFLEACAYEPMGAQGEGKYYDPYPLFFAKALGARVWDVDGNEYIDCWNGAGPCVLGHGNPKVNRAVREEMNARGVLFCAPHEGELRLAKRISELIPSAEMSAFGCGGSDALCYGVRVARIYTGRHRVLKFEGSYHGWYDGLVFSVSHGLEEAGSDDAPSPVAHSAGLPPGTADHITMLPYNNEEAVEKHLAKRGGEYACLVVEPVMHGAGCIVPKRNFLQFLREICDHHGIVLFFDEVLTGFRHHIGGAQTLMGVRPDISAFGKAMSNGYPICALSGKRDIMSMLAPQGQAFFSGTFNGNPLCVAAARKTIDLLSDGSAHKRLWAFGSQFCEGVNDLVHEFGVKAQAVHYGSICSVYFTDQPVSNYRDMVRRHDAATNRAFVDWMVDHGVYTKPKRGNRLMFTTAHTEDDIDRIVHAVKGFFVEHRSRLH